ncbi:MAG TPA: hypothetical protein VFP62_00820 [Burkholderiales bacterium]|jgi:hypothetical protein|nr:hypothetical protein [Burkholderiales bacterium]
MHAELIVQGLFGAPEPGRRLPALELLLARGRSDASEAQSYAAWLGEAFGVEPLPAGALTAGAEGFWVRADPVHFRLMRDRMVLVPVAGLQQAEADALVATLNRQFAGRHEFRAAHPDAWAMRAEPAALESVSPQELAGMDIDPHLPGAPWTVLLNEIQMALHEHPVNEARELPVNSVWLWGAGTLPRSLAGPWRSVSAAEPLAIGLARAAGIATRAPAPSADAWLVDLPGEGRHLAVLEGAAAALEETWFAPLLAALRSDRIGMVTLHLPDAGATVETTRADLRRFWRRPRALGSR